MSLKLSAICASRCSAAVLLSSASGGPLRGSGGLPRPRGGLFQTASSLPPPHRPYDCAIELREGAPLPPSRLYNLSKPEHEAMEDYINESLASGLIRPSPSPVGAGFFFVKKDDSLRPCIDYRGVNDITVKNRYTLPLLDAAFAPLQRAQLFTKLYLWPAYHLVRIRIGMSGRRPSRRQSVYAPGHPEQVPLCLHR